MSKTILILACSYPSNLDPVGGIFVQAQAGVLAAEYSVAVLNPRIYGLRGLIRRIRQPAETDTALERVPVVRPGAFLACSTPQCIQETMLKCARAGLNELCATWGKPDLIAAHFAVHAGWLGLQLARDLNIPYFLHEHASPFSMYLQDSESRALAQLAVSEASAVIAVSPHLEREILDFEPAARTIVVGNFVDTEHFFPGAQSHSARAFTFFSVGKATSQKGFSFLLQAAEILSRRVDREFRVVIGGDGPELPALRSLAGQLGIAHMVDFRGNIPPAEVLQNMRAADCVVMSSLHESFCIVLAEALACGKPVISTRCGGPEFFVNDDNGYLANPADPSDLADKMGRMLAGETSFDPVLLRDSIDSRFGKKAFLSATSSVYNSFTQSAH